MRRSHSHSENLIKPSTLGKKMSFTRTSLRGGSFSKKHEPPLIAPNSDADFLGNEHSTFEMHTITDKNSENQTSYINISDIYFTIL